MEQMEKNFNENQAVLDEILIVKMMVGILIEAVKPRTQNQNGHRADTRWHRRLHKLCNFDMFYEFFRRLKCCPNS